MSTNFTRKTYVDFNTPVVDAQWLNGMQEKVDSLVLLTDNGAVGNGVTDDSVAIQATITANPGKIIDGAGLTYKCNSSLTGITSRTVIQNAKFDFSGCPTLSAQYISAEGTIGTAQTLSSNLAIDLNVVTIPSTAGFVVDQWAFLESNSVWASVDSTVYGQYVKVKSVDSATQLTLYEGPIVPFNTANAATIRPVTPVEQVIFRNVHIIGRGSQSQTGIYIAYGLDCFIERTCTTLNIDYCAVVLYRCINTQASPTVRKALAGGLGYGVGVFGGCFGCGSTEGYGENLRHYVTIGDNDGINMYCYARDNVVVAALAAGIDSHVASYNFICEGNQISLAVGAATEGIVLQGLHNQALSNTVRGVTGIGILFQPLVDGFTTELAKNICTGNQVYLASNVAGTPIGIYFQISGSAGSSWEQGEMSSNTVHGGFGSTGSIHYYVVISRASTDIRNLVISNNVSVDSAISECLWVRALVAGSQISNLVVSNNILRTTGAACVAFGAENATAQVAEIILNGNIIKGGSTANIRLVGTGEITTVSESNSILSGTVTKLSLTGTNNVLSFEYLNREAPTTITASTFTWGEDTNVYTVNQSAAGPCIVTLPSASVWGGRTLSLRTIQAKAVNSNVANVIPRTGGSAVVGILAATAGAWAQLRSNGTNWEIIAGGT